MFSFELSSCASFHRLAARTTGPCDPARILHTLIEEADCAPEEGVSTQRVKTTKRQVLRVLTACKVQAPSRAVILEQYPDHWLGQDNVCPDSVLRDVHVDLS